MHTNDRITPDFTSLKKRSGMMLDVLIWNVLSLVSLFG